MRDIVYHESGIYLEESKKYFLERRVEKRMQTLGILVPETYYARILANTEELKILVEELTINETYFFRNLPQLEGFAKNVLPKILARKRRKDDFTLSIWSAACSTGEEPYTLSIILREEIPDYNKWKIEILGTDISRQVLKSAHRGVYNERSIKDVPQNYLKSYFKPKDGSWEIVDEVKHTVKLMEANLVDKMTMRNIQNIDVIFCRNVLIYFDDKSRKNVLSQFFDSLNRGGYIFLGHSESVGRITAAFKIVRLDNFLCYAK